MKKVSIQSTLYTAAAAMCLVLLVCGGAFAAKALNDKDISVYVDTELVTDDAVAAHLIDVETDNGVVTLSGTVDSILDKERAVRIASGIKGVRAVVDRLSVEPALSRTDQAIQKNVQDALLKNPTTELFEVNVLVDAGEVTLTGTVESWQEKQLCAKVAKNVAGVRSLDTQIDIDITADRADTDIRSEIESVLRWDIWVDDGLLEVDVDDGEVELSGVVGSLREKNRAFNDAWVAGVRDVNSDDVIVDWSARNELRREEKYVVKSDDDVARAVRDSWIYDPRVNSFGPEVEVNSGVAVLRGKVDNLVARRAAAEDAENTVGVTRVRNLIRVRPEDRPDDSIVTRAVRGMLRINPEVNVDDITITTVNGNVQLYGNVDNEYARQKAEEIAAGVNGAIDVDNYLAVRDQTTILEDWEMKQDVKDRLWWNPFVDSDDVNVTVLDGEVWLKGTVDTWAERSAAERNAYSVGAETVYNQLDVRLDPNS